MVLSPDDLREMIPMTKNYIYIDNSATTPVPTPVVDAMQDYLLNYCANIERGAYSIAMKANEAYELARDNVARYLLCCKPEEVILTNNATFGSNLVAFAIQYASIIQKNKGSPFNISGKSIITTPFEHHSNLLPWQRLSYDLNQKVEFVSLSFDKFVKQGLQPEDLNQDQIENAGLICLQHVSNIIGVINPVKRLIREIRLINPEILIFIDGAQAIGHVPVDVKELDCDFYTFSGHKGPLGPPGTGGLFVKKDLMPKMEPLLLGGGIIKDVSNDQYILRDKSIQRRFEAGTPNIVGIIGLGRAAELVGREIGLANISKHEANLISKFSNSLNDISNIEIYSSKDLPSPLCPDTFKSGLICFNIKDLESHAVSLFLDEQYRILTRAGFHCAYPLTKMIPHWEEYSGSVRVSFHYFNTEAEVFTVINAIKTIIK